MRKQVASDQKVFALFPIKTGAKNLSQQYEKAFELVMLPALHIIKDLSHLGTCMEAFDWIYVSDWVQQMLNKCVVEFFLDWRHVHKDNVLFFAWKTLRQNSLTPSTKTKGRELTDIRGVAGTLPVPYSPSYPCVIPTLLLAGAVHTPRIWMVDEWYFVKEMWCCMYVLNLVNKWQQYMCVISHMNLY